MMNKGDRRHRGVTSLSVRAARLLSDNTVLMAQFFRFLAVGGVATVINSFIFYAMVQLGVDYRVSMATGFVTGALFAYLLNSRFTFAAGRRSMTAATGYLLVNLFSLLTGVMFLSFLVEVLGLGLVISGGLVICLTTCLNFLGSKWLVFSK